MPNREQDRKFLKTMAKRLELWRDLVLTGRFDLLGPMTAKAKAKLERVAKLVEEEGMDGSTVRKAYLALYDNDMALKQRENLLADAYKIALVVCAAKTLKRD